MITKKFCVLLIILATSSWADENYLKQTRLADAFFETQNFPAAIDIYQNLLQEPLKPWERAVITSNLGYTLLANSEWEQALTTFKAVPLDNELETFLRAKVSKGIIYTHFYQAIASKNYVEKIDLLKKIQSNLPNTAYSDCSLQKAEGAKSCHPNSFLEKLKFLDLYYLSQALQQSFEEKLTKPSSSDGPKLLLEGVSQSLQQIAFLNHPDFDATLKQQYLSQLIGNNASATPLWSSLKEKLHKNPKDKQRAELLDNAEIEFLSGQNSLKNGAISESKQSFDNSAELLKKLIAIPPPPSPTPNQTPPPNQKPEQPPSQKSSEQESPKNDKKKNADQVLKLLLKMDSEDTKPASQQPYQKKVQRPW